MLHLILNLYFIPLIKNALLALKQCDDGVAIVIATAATTYVFICSDVDDDANSYLEVINAYVMDAQVIAIIGLLSMQNYRRNQILH